jgi:DNA-binding IclR family transcriptional regulator
MDKKYWVPAVEKAHIVLQAIAKNQGSLKLIDLSRQLGISKSSIYSLLNTMEELNWISRDKGDTYSLGMSIGLLGNSFFQQFDLVELFRKEAVRCRQETGESVQMARLEGDQVLYLAKETAPAPVQMVSGPGVKFPAHATGLGKVMLAALAPEHINLLYPEDRLTSITPYTIKTKEELFKQLAQIRAQGFALDEQEGVIGFCCMAAPIYNLQNEIEAAVSVSMPLHHWDDKKAMAQASICALAERLSIKK